MSRYARFKGHFSGKNAIGKPKTMKHHDMKDLDERGYDFTPKQEQKIEKVLHEYKKGTLRSSSGAKVTSHKQAVAIALSEARATKHHSQRIHTSDKAITEGMKVEAEHEKTIKEIKKSNVTVKEAERKIAQDHLKEDPNYYKKLKKMEAKTPKKTWFEQQSPSYRARVISEENYYKTADDRYEKNLRGREVLHEGHDADLVAETPTRREWVSRVTGEIEREKLVNGRWETDDS